jgi:hypothetical protein
LVFCAAVGAAGVPVKVGEASGANPEIEAPDGIVTVPVKVGLASGARLVSVGCTWSARDQVEAVPTAATPFISGVDVPAEDATITLVPSARISSVDPWSTIIPVPAEVLTVTVNAPVVVLRTLQKPLFGTTRVAADARVPLTTIIIPPYCAAVSVVEPPVVLTVPTPDIAVLTNDVVAS